MSRAGEPSVQQRAARALVAAAAFALAITLFLVIAARLSFIPPTAKLGVGRVTLEGASKARDYARAALFYLLVPILTFAFQRAGRRALGDMTRGLPPSRRSGNDAFAVVLLGFTPFLLAPLLWLTTKKEGWAVLLPLALSQIAGRGFVLWRSRHWLRDLLRRDLGPFYALLLAEAGAWVLFRYLHTGARIAHIPTLFLEAVFIVLLPLFFVGAAVLIARWTSVVTGEAPGDLVRAFATGGIPLLLLPFLALPAAEPRWLELAITALALLTIATCLVMRFSLHASIVRGFLVAMAVPALLLCANYAAIASPWHWIDLFHRGESLGPASDYLRGRVPYRDVFVLHGLFDDGFLDAQLMKLFGRAAEVSIARSVVLGAMISPALWYLGIAVFGSMPLALLTVAMGWVTAADNQRAILELAAAAVLLSAWRRRSGWRAAVAGVFAAVALFQSLEIGLYAIIAGFVSLAGLYIFERRSRRSVPAARLALLFGAGIAAGATPVLVWLGVNGALGAFFRDSFGTVPRVIDSIWSLPYPELGRAFTEDLTLRGIALFLLSEKVRFLLNPIVLAVALAFLVARFARRSLSEIDLALLLVTVFGIVTQRSALGRADFPHQYFSAFFISPAIVLLLVVFGRRLGTLWRDAPVVASLLGAAVAALVAVLLWVPDLTNARIDETVQYRARMAGRADLAPPEAATTADRLARITAAVARLSPGQGPVFDFSDQPSLYFYLNRPNATRFYQVPILSPAALQREAIDSLERVRPRLVIRSSPDGGAPFDGIPNDARAAAVAAYLDDRYAFATRRGGVELWVRKSGGGRVDARGYLRRLSVPLDVAPREHLVFPFVAAVTGAGGADWRTDVSIHNPFPRKVPMALRYIAGATREVRFELQPNATWSATDVAGRIFGSPQTRGSLWLDYPPGLRPVATASTYDASRNAPRAIFLAMSESSKAVAGQQLVLLGINPAGRRLNIGLLNVGGTELVARISAVDSDGAPLGQSILQSAAEYEPFLLPDAEHRLAIPLDASVAIRIAIEKGEALGYASLVDPASGASETVAAVPSAR